MFMSSAIKAKAATPAPTASQMVRGFVDWVLSVMVPSSATGVILWLRTSGGA